MRLYLSDALVLKALGSSSPGGGPRTAGPKTGGMGGARTGGGGMSRTGNPGGGPRAGNPGGGARVGNPVLKLNLSPKTPGAATGGSGPQMVACPLGNKCNKGGQHEMGTTILQEHTQEANQQAQTGQVQGDESSGKDTGNPAVPPGAANIGGVGSDQVQVDVTPPDRSAMSADEQQTMRGNKPSGKPAPEPEPEEPDSRQTLPEFKAPAEEDTAYESPSSQRQTLVDPVINLDEERKKQNVSNPMVADESAVPIDSKPMDHYKLAQVARASDDEELAQFHEGMARKRTEGLGSEDHRELADQLTAEGMHEQAKHHRNIYDRVQENSGEAPKKIGPNGERFDLERGSDEYREETKQRPGEHYRDWQNRMKKEHGKLQPEMQSSHSKWTKEYQRAHDEKAKAHLDDFERRRKEHSAPKAEALDEGKHQDSMRDVHHEQRTKASADLEAAKKKHEETKAKAEAIKAKNEEKLKGYEEAKAAHEKAKADAKNATDKANVKRVGKPPEKPKLDKEEKIPEKPELNEPENDADKLRHEGHTDKAKRLADLAESHLKGNQGLSEAQRGRLERAHKMAVYHSNIGYTPTAAHKKELGDVESAISGMGIKQPHEEMKAAEDAKKTAEASKQAEKDHKDVSKQEAAKAKSESKDKAKAEKEAAAQAAAQPRQPADEMDNIRVADHKAKAQKLRAALESHLTSPEGMSPEDQAKAEGILSQLDEHENMNMVPGSAHTQNLAELSKLAGAHSKPYKGEGEAAVTGGSSTNTSDPFHNFTYNMLHQGRALGSTAAASATDPYGRAGQLGSSTIQYGVSGATSAGHHLLRDRDAGAQGTTEPEPTKPAEKRPQQSSMQQGAA